MSESGTAAAGPSAWPQVWPVWVRVLHGTLATSMLAAFATHEGGGVWHERIGYVALSAALLRLLMGVVGPRGERLKTFLRGPAETLRYARRWLRRQAPRHVGHNPLGAWMMLVLLLDSAATGVTGWLFTTDRFWGVAWVEELHAVLGTAVVPLVALHVLGAVLASAAHRENLIGAMVHGRKRPAAGDDVEK